MDNPFKRNKCPDLLLTADWHIREDPPICRIDENWIKTIRDKLRFIEQVREYANVNYNYRIPILHAGDLFNRWNTSPWIISFAARFFPSLIAVAGNHDLPAHNLNNIDRSGFYSLVCFKRIHALYPLDTTYLDSTSIFICGFPYGTKLVPCKDKKKNEKAIALIHHYVYKGRKPFPGAKGGVNSVLDQLEGFDLVVSGDNHIPFTHKNKRGQLLVNCGSLLRLTSDQIDHKPRIYAWYSEENEVDKIYIPIENNVSMEHNLRKKERDNRIEAFVSNLDFDVDSLDLDFYSNLKKYTEQNDISNPVMEKINEALE